MSNAGWDIENQSLPRTWKQRGIEARAIATAAVGKYGTRALTAYAAKRAYEAYFGTPSSAKRRKMSPPSSKRMKLSRRKFTKHGTSKRRGGRKGNGVVRVDGIGGGRRIRTKAKRTHRKKRSLKKRVNALEKREPPKSRYWRVEKELFVMDVAAVNRTMWYAIPLTTKDSLLTTAALINAGANTKTDVDNSRVGLEMKNNRTGNSKVEYQIFRCKANTDEGILEDLRESLTLRGLTVTNTVVKAGGTATSTKSREPTYLVMDGIEQHHPLWHGNRESTSWQPVGNIKKVDIGPGDSIMLSHNSGKLIYDTDLVTGADTGEIFFKHYDYQIVIRLSGGIGHDTTNTTNLGFGFARLECLRTRSTRVSHQDGKGSDKIIMVVADDSTGVGTVEHADDKVSSVTQAVDS